MTIQVFDPPMCCPTGVCGPSVDPELVRFAADLEWLRSKGVEVIRYNLSQQPAAFVSCVPVKAALAREGNRCLPLTLVDGGIVLEGRYPSRHMLAAWAGLVAERGSTLPRSTCCGDGSPEVTFLRSDPGKGPRCC
jgi:hypothetical protein